MITSLRLQNFRSYKDQSFEFEPGVNIVVGPNACGKTNLLEAISLISSGSSIKAKDSDMIMFGKAWARLDGYVGKTNRSVKLTQDPDAALSKEFIIDDKVLRRLVGSKRHPVVIFEPSHLQLLHGSPDGRREFLDKLLEYIKLDFSKISRDYKKTLAQRNRLLKTGKKDKQHMFVWNLRLTELASQIVSARLNLIDEINSKISDTYSGIANKKHKISFNYQSNCDIANYASSLLKKLEANEDQDYQRGFTSHGPHRDDVIIYIDDKHSAAIASRGETRTLLLALKIFELNTIERILNTKPILLLDDVFSELDGARRKALTTYLNTHQSFITTTDADILSHDLVNELNTILLV